MVTDAAASLRTLRIGLRKLWADHVLRTQQYIVAVTSGTPAPPRRLPLPAGSAYGPMTDLCWCSSEGVSLLI